MFFYQISNPLTMGLILILQTLMVALMIGFISLSFWFSYILFLIFVGGMLILFMYSISIISNEKFNFLFNKKIFFSIITMLLMLMILLKKINYFKYYFMMNTELIILFENKLSWLKNESSIHLNKFFNYPTNMINMMMMMYLFFLLIITVNLTNFFYGPMRKK